MAKPKAPATASSGSKAAPPARPGPAPGAAGDAQRVGAERRARGFRALAQDVGRLTAPLFARRGLAAGHLVARWPEVVGSHLAALTLPERVLFARGRREDGTLVIRVDNGALALELQHLAPQLIERVNGFFGYRAVERIKLTQGPLPPRRARKAATAAAEAPAAPPEAVRQRLAGLTDGDLRAALAGLAAARAKRGD